MKRPLFTGCLCFVLCMLPGSLLGIAAGLAAGGIFLAGALVCLALPRLRKASVFAACCALGCLVSSLHLLGWNENQTLLAQCAQRSGGTVSCSGVVQSVQVSSGVQRIILKARRLGDTALKEPITLDVGSISHLPVRSGDLLWGEVSVPADADRPRAFGSGYAEGALNVGIMANPGFSLRDGAVSPVILLGRLQKTLADRVQRLLPGEEGALLNKLVLGSDSTMAREFRAEFYQSGIGHLLAVSGLHVTFLCGSFFSLLGVLTVPRRLRDCLTGVFCIGYVLLTGASFSAMRAGGMMLMALTADFLGRRYDSLTALGISAAGITLFFPGAVLNVGFLLSVGCSLSIICLSGPLERLCLRGLPALGRFALSRWVVDTLCVTLSANLVTVVYSAVTGKRVPVFSVLFNLLSAPVMAPLLACGMLTAVCGVFLSLLPVFSQLFGLLSGLLARGLLLVGEWGSTVSFFGISFATTPLRLWLALSVLIAAAAAALRVSTRCKVFASACCAALLCLVLCVSLLFQSTVTQVDILPTSQGYAVWIQTGTRHILLADAANSSDVQEITASRAFQKHGPCDILISRQDFPRSSASLEKLLDSVKPHSVILTQKQGENRRIARTYPNRRTAGAGDTVVSGGAVSIRLEDEGTLLRVGPQSLWIPKSPQAQPKGDPHAKLLVLGWPDENQSSRLERGLLTPGFQHMTLYFYGDALSAWAQGDFLIPRRLYLDTVNS